MLPASSAAGFEGAQPDLPLHAPLGAVMDVAFDRIAGLVRKVLGVPVGLVSLVDRDGQVFPGQAGLPEPWSETRCTPLTHSFCQYVVRTAEPLIVVDARLDPVLQSNLAIVDVGVVAYAGIPLIDLDGTVVGSLCAIDTVPHDWTDNEVALLRDLAETCSAELQLRTAATAARVAQSRTGALLELSETLSNTHTTADVSIAVSTLARRRLNAAFGGITVLDVDHQRLTYVDLGALPGTVHAEYSSYPLSRPTPSSSAVLTGASFYFETLAEMHAQYPQAADALAGSEARSCAYLPLTIGDRTVGTVSILWASARVFSADDRALLTGLASYTAQAVERALLLADRRQVAETLQAAMLPVLPTVAEAELAGRYLPAHVSDAVGGDWYDAFRTPDGRLTISVGDVEGHDTGAAAVMGQLRSALRSLAIAVPGGPPDVLSALDEVLHCLPLGRRATGILASLAGGATSSQLTWSNAGHLAPLLLVPDEAPRYLKSRPQRLLGLRGAATERTAQVIELPPGSTLLLFTDGLVERADRDLDIGLADLAASAARHRALELCALIDAVLGDLLSGPPDDDVVVLGLRTPVQ